MATQTTQEARAAFLDDFTRLEKALTGYDRPWLARVRREAIERFSVLGFPGAKDEAWKYTSVGPLVRERLQTITTQTPRDEKTARAVLASVAGIDAGDPVAVFVDGAFVAAVSRGVGDRDGVVVESLAERLRRNGDALAEHLAKVADPSVHGFVALNTAFATDGAVLRVKCGAAVTPPVHLVFHSTRRDEPYVTHPRVLVVVEDGAAARVVEHWAGERGAKYLTNAVTEIVLGRNGSLEHVKVQQESDDAHHVHRIQVRQQQSSSLRSHAVALGAAVSRTEITTELAGEGAECSLYGLYVMDGRRHVDHHTTIDHSAARTTSRELYKGILDERARGVFTGKVFVRHAAQQTSAEQANRNLLLSEGAVVETRPQLEIYADDVKCTHGAAVGRLDDDALFYMRQRGIGLGEARTLLTYAFASEVLEGLKLEGLRRDLERTVVRRIGGDGRVPAPTEGVQA